jgi:hypothetical protein
MANVLGYVSTDLEEPYEGQLDLEELDDWYQQKVDEAVRLLIRKIPNIQTRMAAYDGNGSGIDPLFVKDKVLNAVIRVLRNPEGFRSETEFEYSYTRNATEASANVWYTQDELNDLGYGAAAVKPRTVFATNRYGWP